MHYIYLILHVYKQFMHKKGYYLQITDVLASCLTPTSVNLRNIVLQSGCKYFSFHLLICILQTFVCIFLFPQTSGVK